jgi:predicted phage tail protein
MAYWASGAITFAHDAPTGYTDEANQAGSYSTPEAIFGPANVLNGDFTYEGTDQKARHSICLVSWNDPRDNYRQAIEPVEIPELVQRYGQRAIRVTAYGCTSRSQARRFGLWILSSEQLETETVTFTTGLDYADLVPGKIIGVADPHRTGNSNAGRVINSNYYDSYGLLDMTIRLDRTFTFDPSLNYWITYQNPIGQGVITRSVTGFGEVAGLSIIQVNDSSNVIDLPVTNSMYVLTSSTSKYRLFRIIAVKENKGYQYEITAVQHEPAKFDDIDQYQSLVPPGGTPYASWPIAGVQHLTSSVITYVDHGVNKSDITISRSPPPSPNPNDPPGSFDPRVTSYEIWYANAADGAATPVLLSTTTSTSFTMVNVTAGSYWFRVRAITPLGVGPFSQVENTPVTGMLPAPSMPKNLHANVDYILATMFWEPVTDTGIEGYYIYKDYQYLDAVRNPNLTSYQIVFSDTSTHVYSIRAYNSNHPASLSYRAAFADS